MDIERKKNILFLAGSDTHECIEIQRGTDNLEVVMVDKHCKLMEDCLVDIYKQLEKIDLKTVEKLKQIIKTLEAKITVYSIIKNIDNKIWIATCDGIFILCFSFSTVFKSIFSSCLYISTKQSSINLQCLSFIITS